MLRTTLCFVAALGLLAGDAMAARRMAPTAIQRREILRLHAARTANADLERALFAPGRHTNLQLFLKWGLPHGPIALREQGGKTLSISLAGPRLTINGVPKRVTLDEVAKMGVTSAAQLDQLLEQQLLRLAPAQAPGALDAARAALAKRRTDLAALRRLNESIAYGGHADLDLLLQYRIATRKLGRRSKLVLLEVPGKELSAVFQATDGGSQLRFWDTGRRVNTPDHRTVATEDDLVQIGIERPAQFDAVVARQLLAALGRADRTPTHAELDAARAEMRRQIDERASTLPAARSPEERRFQHYLSGAGGHPDLRLALDLGELMARAGHPARPLFLARQGERALLVHRNQRRGLVHDEPLKLVTLLGRRLMKLERVATQDDRRAFGIDTLPAFEAAVASAVLDYYAPEDLPVELPSAAE